MIRGQIVGKEAMNSMRLKVGTSRSLMLLGFSQFGRSLRLVPLPVFKTALGFARGLVGSIPIFSRQIFVERTKRGPT